MNPITFPLVTTLVLSLLFESTRWIALVCMALLTYFFPVLSLVILLLAGITFYFAFYR